MITRLPAVRWTSFALVAIAALYVCFWHLGRQGIVTDEVVYVEAGWEYVHGVVTTNLEHPPTAKYLFGLAQLVFGQGYLGPRLVASAATFLTGIVLFLWLRRPIGFWGALLAAALWWLTPRGNGVDWLDPGSGSAARVDRLALLEPIAVVFAVSSLAAGWAWVRTASRWRFVWAALAGIALAFAVTSKVTPAVLVGALVAMPLVHRRWWDVLSGGIVAAIGFAVTFVALYQPVGLVHAIRYMLAFQTQHDADGHLVQLAGRSYAVAPWWANLYLMAQGVTPVLLVVLVVGVIAALVVRPGRLVVVLAVAVAVLALFLCTARVALAHYYDIWMPFVIALAAIGYTALWQLARGGSGPADERTGPADERTGPADDRPGRVARTALSAVVVVALAATVVPVVQEAVRVAQTRPAGVAVLQQELDAHGASGVVLFTAYGSPQWKPYFLGKAVSDPVPGRYGSIVQGSDVRFPVPATVRVFLREHRADLTAFRVDGLRVWVPRSGAIVIGEDRVLRLEGS